ncbi:peptidoglycan-binding protein [Pseudomonadota bacterium]
MGKAKTIATAEKKRLKISPCKVDGGSVTVEDSKSFEVMLNPASYTHDYSIKYNTTEGQGKAGTDTKFSKVDPEKVSFKIMLDGTGVVETKKDVKTQVKSITDIVYKYNGDLHEPQHVRILWGSLIFYGRLESLKVEYTLFKPGGEPLRATVDLSFSGFMTEEQEAAAANRSSPDLSHQITVRAGDTLPALCYRVYKDSSYYADVARVNNITNFRDIKPGSVLHFPPLR